MGNKISKIYLASKTKDNNNLHLVSKIKICFLTKISSSPTNYLALSRIIWVSPCFRIIC